MTFLFVFPIVVIVAILGIIAYEEIDIWRVKRNQRSGKPIDLDFPRRPKYENVTKKIDLPSKRDTFEKAKWN